MADGTFLGLTQSQWQFINTFGDWFAALGTFAAVVVSLYLANRSSRPKVRVSAGLRVIVEVGTQGPTPEFLAIRVVNTGDRPVRITGVGWKLGLVRKRYADQMTGALPLSSPLPVELQHGQEARWFVPTTHEEGWFKYFAKGMLMPHWKVGLWTLRIQAFSSIGPVFESRPEGGLIQKLADACRELSKQPKG